MGVGELDGSYCFIEGHCTDTKVTLNTTLAEAEKLCDEKYPDWEKVGMDDLSKARAKGGFSRQDGLVNTEISRVCGTVACAMGNYHCELFLMESLKDWYRGGDPNKKVPK